MKTSRGIAIILLNWNGIEDTLLCLSSLEKLYTNRQKVWVVVVDNASTDGSREIIAKKFPKVTLIPLPQNSGFAMGNNTGIEWAMKHDCEYVWILNNDTTVHHLALIELLDEFNDPTVGIAGSKIYFMKGNEFHHQRYKEKERGKVLWYAGGYIDWDNVYASHRGVDEVDHGQYDTLEETDFVTGCSMMMSSTCIETVGAFDPRYFAYLEDLDLSVRAKVAGYRILYVPKSVVWHKNAGSTTRPGNTLHQYYMTRNRLLFGMTYAGFRTKVALIREAFRLGRTGSPAQKKAILDAVTGRWGKQFEWKGQ